MRKFIFIFFLMLFARQAVAGAVTHSSLTNTNQSHELHTGCYQGSYSAMAAVTNQWAGDCYDALDLGTKFYYQSSVPAPTPANGTGSWVPLAIKGTFTRTWTPTITPTPTNTVLTSTPTFTNTLTSTLTFTSTSTYTPTFTPTPTFTYTRTPTFTGTLSPTVWLSYTSTSTFSPTLSPTPTNTFSPTFTWTNTFTVTPTPTSTNSPTATATFTPYIYVFSTSATAIPTQTNSYVQMSGNSVTLCPGTWRIGGMIGAGNDTVAVTVTGLSYVWSSVEGDNTNTLPATLVTGGNIVVNGGVMKPSYSTIFNMFHIAGAGAGIQLVVPEINVTVNSNYVVYLDSLVNYTSSNSTVLMQTSIWATKEWY